MHKSLPVVSVVVLCLALVVGFFPIALFTGKIETFWSARAAAGMPSVLIDALVCFGLCAFVVLTLLVWPMAFAGFLHEQSSWTRALTVSVLWCLPAVGFGYFVGEYLSPLQLYDYLIAIILPVSASAVLYWRSQKWVEVAVFASVALFFGIFLVGDVLGPFPTFVRFSSEAVGVYALRTVLSFAAFAAAALIPLRQPGQKVTVHSWSPATLVLGTAVLGGVFLVLRLLVDGDSKAGALSSSDLAPAAMLLVAWVLLRKERFSRGTMLIVCSTQVLALAIPVLRSFTAPTANLSSQLQLGYQTLALCLFVWVVAALRTQPVHHAGEGSGFS